MTTVNRGLVIRSLNRDRRFFMQGVDTMDAIPNDRVLIE